LLDHLEHLRETKDLFGNLAKSFAASEKLMKTKRFFGLPNSERACATIAMAREADASGLR
jgi:hypothetical protein